MFLKFLPKHVDLGAMVHMTILNAQSTLMRVQEIQDIEKRRMTKAEMIALKSLLDTLTLASDSAKTLYKNAQN